MTIICGAHSGWGTGGGASGRELALEAGGSRRHDARMGAVMDAEQLRGRLHEVRILDARAGPEGRRAYERQHLVGAVYADLEADLAAPTDAPERGGRHPLPPLERWTDTLGRWGIGPQTPVVVYDDRGGMMAAARAWWMLRAVGHQEVHVLDGGLPSALEAGLPTTDRPPQLEARPPYPAQRWRLPTADADTVERVRTDPGWRVLDVRAPERYRGETEPLDPVAGHIPGAVNLPCTGNLSERGGLHAPDELAARYRELLGDVSPDRIVVSCGSGVTACHTLLALEHAGLSGASLYVGSWSEWCRSGRPREPGP